MRVRDRRLRLTPLLALFVLVMELERAMRGLRGETMWTAAGAVGWAIVALDVA